MTIKADSKRIRANIASTRHAMANARNRAIPKFKHPVRPKAGAAAAEEPKAEPVTEETTTTTPEPDQES